MMTHIAKDALDTAKAIDPNAPIVEAAEAVVNTSADPSPANLLNDIELAIGFVKQLRALLNTAHPSVTSLVKKLLFS